MEGLVNNSDLFMVLREQIGSLADNKKLCDYLKQTLNIDWTEETSKKLLKFCQKFCSNVCARWEKSNRTLSNFKNNNGNWLKSAIVWPEYLIVITQTENVRPDNVSEDVETLAPPTPIASTSSAQYTPRKPFEELSNKQKRRRVERLTKSVSPQELKRATMKNLAGSGDCEVSKIMEHLLNHPEDIAKVQNVISQEKNESLYTPEKALALSISLKLSKWQYINLRNSAIDQGAAAMYPSYYKIKLAKLFCYPEKIDIIVTKDGASIKLQALLNLTTLRLLDAMNFNLTSEADLKLICKWGFDGASSQSNYKQKAGSAEFDDSSVFMASLVPIRLMRDEEVLWENDRPSSTFYCRPIMFQFTKESESLVNHEKEDMEQQIEALQPYKLQEVTVKHQLLLTLIDGKITSYISETSTAVCDICKAKPSEMNNLEDIDRRTENEDMYQYGLSSLHAWIRCMECLLHIGYRMEFKKWSSRGEDKEKLAQRKKLIQQAFKDENGLLVDVVKQGAGTTNDGNTARRFFSDAKTSARITGVDEELIERFHVILQTVASGEQVDLIKFSQFCKNTATLYVQLYPWYYMPSSVHKLLVHGTSIIKHFGLMPIGKLSEEALEARNKDFRKYREHHSRKVSRTATNEDIMHNLLLSSDPKLTFLRPRMPKQRRMALSPRARELLMSLPAEPELEFIDVDALQVSDSDSD